MNWKATIGPNIPTSILSFLVYFDSLILYQIFNYSNLPEARSCSRKALVTWITLLIGCNKEARLQRETVNKQQFKIFMRQSIGNQINQPAGSLTTGGSLSSPDKIVYRVMLLNIYALGTLKQTEFYKDVEYVIRLDVPRYASIFKFSIYYIL